MKMNSELSRLETHESDYNSKLDNSKYLLDFNEENDNKIFDSFPTLPYCEDWPALNKIDENID